MADRHTRRIYLALAEGRDLSPDEERHLAGCKACRAAADHALGFERVLHRDLATEAVPLPADPRGVPADSAGRASAGLVAGLVLVAAIGVGGAAAMLAMPEPTPAPEPTRSGIAATAQPTATPSAQLSPSMSDSPPPVQLAAGDYAQLAVRDLSLHDGPDGEPFAGINPGSDIWIVEVREDWYLVEAREEQSVEYLFGWVPSATTIDTDRGPEVVPTLSELSPGECEGAMPWIYVTLSYHPQRQLECLADSPVVFDGYAIESNGNDDAAYGGQPAWLAEAPELIISSVIGPAVTGFSVFAHLPADREFTIPTSDRDGHDGVLLRITGHFVDPASGSCDRVPLKDGYPPMDQRLNEIWCRQQLVVDAVSDAPAP